MLKAVQHSMKIHHTPLGKQAIVRGSDHKGMQRLANALKGLGNKYIWDGYFSKGEHFFWISYLKVKE